MTAYVTQAEVLATFDVAPTAAAKLARIDALIPAVCAELDHELGFTFERFPTSSTATFLARGEGGQILHLHGDQKGLAVVPTTMSFATVWAGALTLIAAADYVVEQWDPASGQYDHIRLLGVTSGFTQFPNGPGLISFLGAQGFAATPANVKEAILDRIRQLYHADPALVGGLVGPEEADFTMAPSGYRGLSMPRWPDTFFKVLTHYRTRYAGCYV
jgi:hypothetical protein